MMNAIFWGIYPPSEDSPHSLIFKFIGLDTQPNKYIHLLIGTIFLYCSCFNISTTIYNAYYNKLVVLIFFHKMKENIH